MNAGVSASTAWLLEQGSINKGHRGIFAAQDPVTEIMACTPGSRDGAALEPTRHADRQQGADGKGGQSGRP